MALTEEQRQRKNEMAKLNRAKKKQSVKPESKYESDSDGAIEDAVENEVEEVEEVEDPEIARKRAIADKRCESLTLARSKIRPKSQITKEKDTEIALMKAENERLRSENAKVMSAKPKVIEKYIEEVPQPIRQRPVRREREPRQEREREPSIDYLAQQSYAEQLQTRLRDNMLQRMMSDTFM